MDTFTMIFDLHKWQLLQKLRCYHRKYAAYKWRCKLRG